MVAAGDAAKRNRSSIYRSSAPEQAGCLYDTDLAAKRSSPSRQRTVYRTSTGLLTPRPPRLSTWASGRTRLSGSRTKTLGPPPPPRGDEASPGGGPPSGGTAAALGSAATVPSQLSMSLRSRPARSSPDVDYGTQIHTTPAAKTSKPDAANVSPVAAEVLPATAKGSPLPAEGSPLPAKGSPLPAGGSAAAGGRFAVVGEGLAGAGGAFTEAGKRLAAGGRGRRFCGEGTISVTKMRRDPYTSQEGPGGLSSRGGVPGLGFIDN